MKTLSSEIRNCKKCSLSETRKNVVIGKGSPAPDILFIGEAPGEEEDNQGKPFVGRSGMLLDRCITENGIKNYAVINIIKCRPPENRKPTSDEVKSCSPWLDQQVALLNPKIIVCLGATALNYFFPDKTITKSVQETLLSGKTFELEDRRYIAIFHPSYILRGKIQIPEYIKMFERIPFFLGNGEVETGREADKIQVEESISPEDESTNSYVPLHVHWEHGSIADVFGTDKERAEDFSKKGFKAAAITDHGSLSSLYYAQESLKEKGIKPIIGIEAYVRESEREQSHIILLVKNQKGYENLLRLHSISKDYVHKIFNKTFQKIPIDEICKHSEGLICSTACISGTIAKRWRRDDYEGAEQVLQKLHDAFGKDLYVELMPNRMDDQRRFNEYVLALARKYAIKPIITTDSHYNSPEDKPYHDVIKAIEKKVILGDKSRKESGKRFIADLKEAGFSDDTFANLTTAQISSLLKSHHPTIYPIRKELFTNTIEVSDKCNFEIPSHLGETLPGDEEVAKAKILARIDLDSYIKNNDYDPNVVHERIDKEIDLISSRKFFNYFDKVLEMTDYADSKGIPRGPGRGSVGGSLLAYLLGITKVDPLRFGTLWERFLSPSRTPDIDLDFSAKKRDVLIGHLKLEFDAKNICNIITFNEWSDKSAVKDVARIYDVPLIEVNKFTKELSTKTAENLKIEDIIITSDSAREFASKYPKVIDAALKLKGKIRHVGLHAAGVCIVKDLERNIPTEIYDRDSYKNLLVSSYEKDALEKLGIVKFDVLGLSILDVIDETLKNSGLTWKDLPEDYSDPKVFILLKSSKTAGIFQFGSQLVTDYLRKLNPNSFDDLVATNALCRPGPLNSGMSFDYVDRKGGKEWTFDHPTLEPITKNTYGIICYQEQIMQVANQIGNFSMVDSEKFMKQVAKSKGRDVLKESEEKMLAGAVANGFSKQQFDDLFNKILEFGRYGFNLSHSIEYSMLGYFTSWLKLYYPLAFYTALINDEKDEDQTLVYIKEAMDSGITIKPPSVETPSELTAFNKDKNIIFLGLNKVKGIGPEEIKKVIAAGRDFNKIKRIKKNIFQTLVEVGYLDSVEKNRKQLLTGKELTKNTLWAWSTENNTDGDWTEEERMFRLRKSLPWPRSYDELPVTKYDGLKKQLISLKGESTVDNKAFLSVGWVYDFKAFNNATGTSYVLNFEDGTSRVTLNMSPLLVKRHSEIIERIAKGEQNKPLIFCLHPYYMNRGKTELRDGKLQILWMGDIGAEVPKNVLNGIGGDIENLKDNEFLVTNINYGISKAGNSFSSVECIDAAENVTYGAIIAKGGGPMPVYGSIIKGKWNETPRGTFWRGE